jgi:putative membrane protein
LTHIQEVEAMNKLRMLLLGALMFAGQQALGTGFLTPQEFVARASAAGLGEVELGKLALQKSSAADIRAFAQKMVEDHSRSGTELAALAKARMLPVATQPNEAQRAALAQLRQKTGQQFDEAWTGQMVKDHDEAVLLFSAAGTLEDDDAELAAFSRKLLPVLTEHQQLAAHLGKVH